LAIEADECRPSRAEQESANQNAGPTEARRVLGGRPVTTVKINGRELLLKECPECHREVISLVQEFRNGKVVRIFCHLCHQDPDSPMVTVSRKIHDHAIAGTLDQYPLAERIAELEGKPYVKPN
jgi:hypothetical protein